MRIAALAPVNTLRDWLRPANIAAFTNPVSSLSLPGECQSTPCGLFAVGCPSPSPYSPTPPHASSGLKRLPLVSLWFCLWLLAVVWPPNGDERRQWRRRRSSDVASVSWSLLSSLPPSRGKPGADCLGKAFVCIFVATCYSEVCAQAPGAYRWASDGFLPPTDWKWKRVLSSTSSLTLFPMVRVLAHLWHYFSFFETRALTLFILCQQTRRNDFNPLLCVKVEATHIEDQCLFRRARQQLSFGSSRAAAEEGKQKLKN